MAATNEVTNLVSSLTTEVSTATSAHTNDLAHISSLPSHCQVVWVIFLVVLVSAILAGIYFCKLVTSQVALKEIPGKKDLVNSFFFLFTVLAALAIISLLALADIIEKQNVTQLLLVILTALGVKKVDSGKD